MATKHESDSATGGRLPRPVLIASRTTLAEQAAFLRHLLVGLLDEPISASLICPPGCDGESVAPAPMSVLTHPAIDLPVIRHFGIEQLAVQLEKLKPTVLHSLCESTAVLARRLASRLNLPYVQAVSTLTGRLCRVRLSRRYCAMVLVPAESIRTRFGAVCPRFADRIRQINVGTFVEGEVVCFSDAGRLPSIVLAQALRRISAFEPLLRAVKALFSDGYEFMVVLMGSGPAEYGLRQLVAELGLSQAVTIVPMLDPWRCVLAAGDIFVQPQPLRAFSVFLLEAMSVGTAVAACPGGVDDLLIPNQTAVVFEPDSEQSIRQALARLLDERDFARRLAKTAQEHVRASHSVSAMVSATLDAYAEVQERWSG